MSNGTRSEFMRSLGPYSRPEPGEKINTEYGTAVIIEIKDYEEVIEDMQRNSVSRDEIDGFNIRVKHFLGNPKRYFECVIRYRNGEFDTIDWSEYLASKRTRM